MCPMSYFKGPQWGFLSKLEGGRRKERKHKSPVVLYFLCAYHPSHCLVICLVNTAALFLEKHKPSY